MIQKTNDVIPHKLLPKVSVVVPILNGERDLPEFIQCLEKQTYPRDQVNYILVDNGSSDSTSRILSKAVCSCKVAIFPILYTQIQSSYAARNAGIRAATGDIMIFTDVDCRPTPCWLRELIKPFKISEVGIVAGSIVALIERGILCTYAFQNGVLSHEKALAHPFLPYAQTANVAIRRAVFEQVGLFRSYLTTGGDADLCWRVLQQTSWQLVRADEALVKHRHRHTLWDLYAQFRRYGRSQRYLHELYGTPLPPVSFNSWFRITRWIIKDFPRIVFRILIRRASAIDLFRVPISLLIAQARVAGSREPIPSCIDKIERL